MGLGYLFVPLEGEDGTLVLAERRRQPAVRGPNARVAVVRAGGQQSSVALSSRFNPITVHKT